MSVIQEKCCIGSVFLETLICYVSDGVVRQIRGKEPKSTASKQCGVYYNEAWLTKLMRLFSLLSAKSAYTPMNRIYDFRRPRHAQTHPLTQVPDIFNLTTTRFSSSGLKLKSRFQGNQMKDNLFGWTEEDAIERIAE